MTKASDKSIGLRIRTIRKRLGLNQTRFGKLFGVTQEAVSGWENGAYPDGLRLLEISKCGHTRIEWILTGDPFWRFGPVSDKVMNKIRSDPAERHYIRCPLLHEHVASGPPKEIGDEDIAESLWMPSEIGHQRNYLMRVRDGAMEPIFKKDDLVSMQTWSQDLVPLTGQIVAAWLPKEGIITRWLSNEQGMWILRPQSRGYSIFPIEKKEETTFFKVLCWCGKQTQHGIPPA